MLALVYGVIDGALLGIVGIVMCTPLNSEESLPLANLKPALY